jgi:hypothetical protein
MESQVVNFSGHTGGRKARWLILVDKRMEGQLVNFSGHTGGRKAR